MSDRSPSVGRTSLAVALCDLLREGMDDIERGDVVEMSPDSWPSLIREADEEDRLGVPTPDHVQPEQEPR